jgi:hypothetical protein
MMSLRDKIKGTVIRAETFLSVLTSRLDNFRYVYGLAEGQTRLAIATHDNLYWVIVDSKPVTTTARSSYGHKTEEAALQAMAESLSEKVWKKAKENGITLAK